MALTKKEKESLRSQKMQVHKDEFQGSSGSTDGSLRYTVMMSLTPGELSALKNALGYHATSVGQDVFAYLNNALTRAGIEIT